MSATLVRTMGLGKRVSREVGSHLGNPWARCPAALRFDSGSELRQRVQERQDLLRSEELLESGRSLRSFSQNLSRQSRVPGSLRDGARTARGRKTEGC